MVLPICSQQLRCLQRVSAPSEKWPSSEWTHDGITASNFCVTAILLMASGACTEEEEDSDDDDDAGEHVGREEFVLVTRSMLEKAQEQRDMLQQALQRGYAQFSWCITLQCGKPLDAHQTSIVQSMQGHSLQGHNSCGAQGRGQGCCEQGVAGPCATD